MTDTTVTEATEPQIDTSKVIVERVENVLVLTINRPDQRNAVDHDVAYLIGTALEDAEADPDVRCIVVTGAGEMAFSAGLDLKALARGEAVLPKGMEKWNFAGFTRHFTNKPTIAAVNGTALGGGTELAVACDLIVAAENATFGLPEVKRGLIAGGGGVLRLANVLPQKIALEMLFTGEPMTASVAERWGLVNQVVPVGKALEAALALATRISCNAPLAVQASKRLAYRIAEGEPLGEAEQWKAMYREAGMLWQSKDAQEGPRAFAEKRAPVWTGS